MVVGAMLLAGHSATTTGAGLGIPKSPSFHSGLELAAATKDIQFQDLKTRSIHNISDYSKSEQTSTNPIACAAAYWSKGDESTTESITNPFGKQSGEYSVTESMPSFTNAMVKVDAN